MNSSKNRRLRKLLTLGSLLAIFSAACTLPTGVFEKNVSIPGQAWKSSFTPTISFRITDTVSRYNIFLVIRHRDAYDYNNIWIRATVQEPGDTARKSQAFDLALASNEKGWIGSAMDDIYEARLLLQQQTRFLKPGEYTFTLEQIMREDPLKQVLDVGIRIEKTQSDGR